MILAILMLLSLLLKQGVVFASKLAQGSANWTHIPLAFTPTYTLFLIAYVCHQCNEISKDLRGLLGRSKCAEGAKLVELYSQQVDMQPIEIELGNYQMMKIDFYLNFVVFVIDYDIVLLQFYLS